MFSLLSGVAFCYIMREKKLCSVIIIIMIIIIVIIIFITITFRNCPSVVSTNKQVSA